MENEKKNAQYKYRLKTSQLEKLEILCYLLNCQGLIFMELRLRLVILNSTSFLFKFFLYIKLSINKVDPRAMVLILNLVFNKSQLN